MRRHLVYTSAGDGARLEDWVRGPRDFDLWVTDYGEDAGGDRLRRLADHYDRHRGGKFPNLHRAARRHPERIAAYDAVLVMDDDIRIDARAIDRLFEIRAEHDLWLLQPAFHPRGQISHPITCVRARTRLRFTNFVEVTCPLFRRDKLEDFLRVYDPRLVGWGVDWWFCEHLGGEAERRVAIADEVVCTNPRASEKGGRAIDRLQPAADRRAAWETFKAERGLVREDTGARELGALPRPWPSAACWALRLAAGGHYRRARRQRRRARDRLGLAAPAARRRRR